MGVNTIHSVSMRRFCRSLLLVAIWWITMIISPENWKYLSFPSDKSLHIMTIFITMIIKQYQCDSSCGQCQITMERFKRHPHISGCPWPGWKHTGNSARAQRSKPHPQMWHGKISPMGFMGKEWGYKFHGPYTNHWLIAASVSPRVVEFFHTQMSCLSIHVENDDWVVDLACTLFSIKPK